jgi:WD40 repeat protein
MLLGMRFSPKGKFLTAVGLTMEAPPGGGFQLGMGGTGGKETFNLWNVESQQVIEKIEMSDGGTGGISFFEPPVFSPDERLVAYSIVKPHVVDDGGAPKRGFSGVRIRETATGKEKVTHPLMAHQVLRFLDDGKTLVGAVHAPQNLAVQTCDIETGKSNTTVSRRGAETSALGTVTLSPDGEVVASTVTDHRINLWQVRTGRKLATLSGPRDKFLMYQPNLVGGGPRPFGRPLRFSEDCRRLVGLAFFGDKPPGPGVVIGSQTKNGEVKATVWDVERFCCVQGQNGRSQHPGQGDGQSLADDNDGADVSPTPVGSEGETAPPADTKPPPKTRRARTWTSADGQHKACAELVRTDGDDVILKTEDGRVIRVPLEKLSRADQSYVRVMSRQSQK